MDWEDRQGELSERPVCSSWPRETREVDCASDQSVILASRQMRCTQTPRISTSFLKETQEARRKVVRSSDHACTWVSVRVALRRSYRPDFKLYSWS